MSARPPGGGPWTVLPLLKTAAEYLAGKGVPSARLDAELLLARALGCSRIELYTASDRPVDEPTRAKLRELVRRRAEREPVAYILGGKEFYGRAFQVSPAVLVPRPETELLVAEALAWARAREREALSILDLGTGSGCLAVTLACELPGARVTATDASEDALHVAARNVARYELTGRVDLRAGAGFEPVAGDRFDLVVCNPPYVPEHDAVDPEVRHEPPEAVFAGADGLDAYRALAPGLADALEARGLALFELGAGQAGAVCELLRAAGFAHVDTRPDPAGHERVLRVCREPLPGREAGGEIRYEMEPLAAGRDVSERAPRERRPEPDREAARRAALEAQLDAWAEGGDEPPPGMRDEDEDGEI